MMTSSATPDLHVCNTFIKFWLERTGAPHITLVAIVPDGPTTTTTYSLGHLGDALDWIEKCQLNEKNVYFQPNETPFGCVSKPRKSTMVAALTRFADIDPLDAEIPLKEERARLSRLAVALAEDQEFPPTAVVDSGNGLQLIWVVEREPLSAEAIDRIEAETRDIEAALGAGGTQNIDRLLRLPGTVNFPSAKKRRLGRGVSHAKLIHCEPITYSAAQAAALGPHFDARFADSDLVRRKPKKGVSANTTNPKSDGDVAALIGELRSAGAERIGSVESLPLFLKLRLLAQLSSRNRLSDRWSGLVDDLTERGLDDSRSAADFSLAAMLKAAGFSPKEVGLLLFAYPHGKIVAGGWVSLDQKLRHAARCALRSYDQGRADTNEQAEENKAGRTAERTDLLVDGADLPATAIRIRDILATQDNLYDRGVPVRLVFDERTGGVMTQLLRVEGIVREVHRVARPHARTRKADQSTVVPVTLSDRVARLYLDMQGEWKLRPLNGIANAPLLRPDGTIISGDGYDPGTGFYSEHVPDVTPMVPMMPMLFEAKAALTRLRERFRTFAFADATFISLESSSVPVVDVSLKPGRDESAFLCGLLTAVCRPSLPLAPGLMLTAASMSGAGAGKGLLARCICSIAFGRPPHAVTGGSTVDELEKRIASELMLGGPVLFLDNLNGQSLRSDLLASAITERPARIRVLGRSEMVLLNASAFIVLTGNGLTVSEDLARRFITVELDPGSEDPEARPFTGDILAEVSADRAALLADVLTIWRWGAMNDLPRGRPMGSFRDWAQQVRDPLLALGCTDPADRVSEAKSRDTRRQMVGEVFAMWWECHHDLPITAALVDQRVIEILDPQGRGRQFIAAALEKLAGTRMAGFVLVRKASIGKWGAATYSLRQSEQQPASIGVIGGIGAGASVQSETGDTRDAGAGAGWSERI